MTLLEVSPVEMPLTLASKEGFVGRKEELNALIDDCVVVLRQCPPDSPALSFADVRRYRCLGMAAVVLAAVAAVTVTPGTFAGGVRLGGR